jgi:hypothetical protein
MTMTIDGTTGATFPDGSQQAKSGSGPAFSAYLSSTTSITTSVRTKIAANTEEYDTANAYDSATNYRFQPTVAGYYECTAQVEAGGTTSSPTYVFACIYKNGAEIARTYLQNSLASVCCTKTIFLNGSTDYVEGYAQINATTPQLVGGASTTFFQGCLARPA